MLLMFKDGVLVEKHQGNYPKEKLESMIMNKLSLSLYWVLFYP